MKRILSLLFVSAFVLMPVQAQEIDAIYWAKGKGLSTKIKLEIPDNWVIIKSKDNTQYGDYIVTDNKTVYMNFTLSEWPDYTASSFADMRQRNGFTKHVQGDSIVFAKEEISARGRRFELGRFIGTSKISLATTVMPYDGHAGDSLAQELKEAISILATLEVLPLTDSSHLVDPKFMKMKQSIDDKLKSVTLLAQAGKVGKFPNICATFHYYEGKLKKDSHSPQDILAYAQQAKQDCNGKFHAQALHINLKNKGGTVCEATEVTLQIRHIKANVKATNKADAVQIWESFVKDYQAICPGRYSGN